MSTRARVRRDGLERQIEAALEPGRFVGDRGCFSFVDDLEVVEREVAGLVETEPARAVSLYEAFLAGCHEKADEIDDSSGSFGDFVGGLFCGWVKARQAAGASPHETAARLLGWIEGDPYGFCWRIEKDRAAWHERAIEAAAGSDLYSLIDLLLEAKEIESLVALVRRSRDDELERVSHYTLEPAANKLEKTDATAAAGRLWRAMGMRIVNAGKSKYYEAALQNFARAKRCYTKAGRDAGWQQVVNEVRTAHQRKYGFMPRFEQLVSGTGPASEPPFLERAKARWIT